MVGHHFFVSLTLKVGNLVYFLVAVGCTFFVINIFCSGLPIKKKKKKKEQRKKKKVKKKKEKE